MTEVLIYEVVASVAAVFGAIAGRVFAVEAQGRLTAIFAGAYVAAGVKTWGWYFFVPLVSWSVGLALGGGFARGLAQSAARRD